jgi:hypothetical protein
MHAISSDYFPNCSVPLLFESDVVDTPYGLAVIGPDGCPRKLNAMNSVSPCLFPNRAGHLFKLLDILTMNLLCTSDTNRWFRCESGHFRAVDESISLPRHRF